MGGVYLAPLCGGGDLQSLAANVPPQVRPHDEQFCLDPRLHGELLHDAAGIAGRARRGKEEGAREGVRGVDRLPERIRQPVEDVEENAWWVPESTKPVVFVLKAC